MLRGSYQGCKFLKKSIKLNLNYSAFLQNSKEYHCSHIKDSPFTLVIVNNIQLKTVYYDDSVQELGLTDNKLVTFFYPRRDVCQWKLDEYAAHDRFRVWSDISEKEICAQDDMRLPRAFTKGLGSWTQSWPKSGKKLHFRTSTIVFVIPYIFQTSSTQPACSPSIQKMHRFRIMSTVSCILDQSSQHSTQLGEKQKNYLPLYYFEFQLKPRYESS